MSHSRCPTCICGYDGTNERPGVPRSKEIQSMTAQKLVFCLGKLNISYSPFGNQEITLGGNLNGVCQQRRATFLNALARERLQIVRILATETEESDC